MTGCGVTPGSTPPPAEDLGSNSSGDSSNTSTNRQEDDHREDSNEDAPGDINGQPPPPPPQTPAPAPDPTLSTDFNVDDGIWNTQLKKPGSISFGMANADTADNKAASIILPGDATAGPNSFVGPGWANQIETKQFLGFGTYRARVKPASCAADEEVVNGIFVYSNDGSDLDNNGLIDNNEIDIEILCGEPNAIYLTSWTDYTDDSNFLKVSRKVDFATGKVYQTEPGKEGEYGLGSDPVETITDAILPGFSLTAQFLEMGFEWHSAQVRFFIVINGKEITLWNFTDKKFIPQHPAQFMLNVWHASSHWYGGSADYPEQDTVMTADWFKFWAE